ncbi:hypothetical protein [Lacimicrobium alkaliphilum]|uniref:Uncharacterized protein n=1 Tax=Lacimicrobium alkaliphilum TaxID=1526571 RepID=A0A0U3AXC0_9ALTE|nr:hypothetical protein [Lacimicrobium alkaliphilum]ALS98767.1 hypothetical protein AT746_11115 [Lacimicrobium alkaliphilum]
MVTYSLKQRWRHFKLKFNKQLVVQAVAAPLLRQIIRDYEAQGWERDRMHSEVDIEQSFQILSLRKGNTRLDFSLTDEQSGDICGPDNALLALARQYQLQTTRTPDS